MNGSIKEVWRGGAKALEKFGVADARREAGALLAHVMGKDRTFLLSHPEDLVGASNLAVFVNVIHRRAAGEPAQYIMGTQDFYGRAFRVTPAVLIPRPETELLVEAALSVMNANAKICDVGTGSGCIAITLLCERSDAQAVAIDVSEEALEIARENASERSVEARIRFVTSDCFTALDQSTDQFDVIVSNPPYVSEKMLPGLQREVRDHEPHVALSPGEDGLRIIRRLLDDSPRFIRGNGHLIMEIGFDQGEAVQQLVDENVWKLKEIRPDLQCIPRIVVLQKK